MSCDYHYIIKKIPLTTLLLPVRWVGFFSSSFWSLHLNLYNVKIVKVELICWLKLIFSVLSSTRGTQLLQLEQWEPDVDQFEQSKVDDV